MSADQPTPDQRAQYDESGFVRLAGFAEIVDHDMGAAEPVLMDPGDLLLFDSHLMHRSTDNRATTIRAAMVYHYAATGTVDHRSGPVNDFVTVR